MDKIYEDLDEHIFALNEELSKIETELLGTTEGPTKNQSLIRHKSHLSRKLNRNKNAGFRN